MFGPACTTEERVCVNQHELQPNCIRYIHTRPMWFTNSTEQIVTKSEFCGNVNLMWYMMKKWTSHTLFLTTNGFISEDNIPLRITIFSALSRKVPLHDVTAGVYWSLCVTNTTTPDILRPSFHTDMLRIFGCCFLKYLFDYEGIYAFYSSRQCHSSRKF